MLSEQGKLPSGTVKPDLRCWKKNKPLVSLLDIGFDFFVIGICHSHTPITPFEHCWQIIPAGYGLRPQWGASLRPRQPPILRIVRVALGGPCPCQPDPPLVQWHGRDGGARMATNTKPLPMP